MFTKCNQVVYFVDIIIKALWYAAGLRSNTAHNIFVAGFNRLFCKQQRYIKAERLSAFCRSRWFFDYMKTIFVLGAGKRSDNWYRAWLISFD